MLKKEGRKSQPLGRVGRHLPGRGLQRRQRRRPAAAQRPVERNAGRLALLRQRHAVDLRCQQGAPGVFELQQAGQPVVVERFGAGEGGAVAVHRCLCIGLARAGALQRDPRFLDVAPTSTTAAHRLLAEPDFGTSASYDAFYLLAYATSALAPGEPVTGASLAKAFARLVPSAAPGTRPSGIDVGRAGILDAYRALQAGERIDLGGASGALDFDLATGSAPLDQAISCLAVGGGSVREIDSGLVFRASSGLLEGTMRCTSQEHVGDVADAE